MAHKHTIEELNFRKHILEQRTGKDNSNIIKKIDRNIAILARKRKREGIGKRIFINPFKEWEGVVEEMLKYCQVN